MMRARLAAVTLSAAPPKRPGPRMRTSAKTKVPRSSAIRSISPCRQRQLRSMRRNPAARSRSAQRSSAPAPSRFMARLTNLESARLTGTLYIVATPIGNLADMSTRAIAILRTVDLIACEDTRTTRTLLSHYGVATRSIALREHNERAASDKLIKELREGKSIALVSDAGTPAVSDPGAWLVAQAHKAGVRVSPVPGASAAAAAFSAAGFPSAHFLFAGFLPAQGAARRRALESLDVPYPVVLYEAPHRIEETLKDLTGRLGGEREMVIARELTKRVAEVGALRVGRASEWLAGRRERRQGEFVLVLAAGGEARKESVDAERVLEVLLEALAPSEAAKLAAKIIGLPKNALYRKAVDLAKGGGK